jgi:hypothetical protein
VLHSGGQEIGTFLLSIQDDEGYLRLMRRLAGIYVLMYMGNTLVKNSLGPSPGSVPARGSYTYRGRHFRVFTLEESAFPSGPLHIRVLVPIPYSLGAAHGAFRRARATRAWRRALRAARRTRPRISPRPRARASR